MDKLKGKWLSPLGASIIFAIIAILSFYLFFRTTVIYRGDDLWFHLERQEYWYQLFSSNQFYNYGNFYSSSQFGIPLDIFYPFLTYMPITFIRMLVSSPIASWYIFWVLHCWITLMICYKVGNEVWKRRDVAFLFSLFYYFSAYRLLNVFLRTAVGESLAMTFFPLVILGVYKLINQEREAWIPLSLGMVLVAYSHMLSTIIIIPFLIILSLMNYRLFLKKETWWELIKAVSIFLLLTMIVILPIMEQFKTFGVLATQASPILNNTTQPLFNFLFISIKNTLIHTSLGTMVTIVILCAPFLYKRLSKGSRQLIPLVWLLIFFMCFMDFDLLQDTLFSSIQFIWRLNSIITLFSAFIFGDLINYCFKHFKYNYTTIIVSTGILCIGFFSIFRIYDYFQRNPYNLPIWTQEHYDQYIGTGRVVDYLPEGPAQYIDTIKVKQFFNSPEIIDVTYESKDNTIIFDVISQNGGEVNTFIPYYVGVTVHTEGEKIETISGWRGTVMLYPGSDRQRFIVSYSWTPIQIMAWVISWGTWLCLGIYFVVKKVQLNRKR